MAGGFDFAHLSIDGDRVYGRRANRETLSTLPPGLTATSRARHGLDPIRLLATLCIISWTVVAVETWLLVR